MLDATHAPTLKSWVPSANQPGTDFPIQNLPLGRFRRAGSTEPLRVGVAIGDEILDLQQALAAGGWSAEAQAWLAPMAAGDLNAFMAQGPAARKGLRAALSAALREGSAQQAALAPCLVAQSAAEMALPCQIGDYTDFYTGIHHATTVGKLFRPDNPLLPNYKWVPIGYHGRVSSIGVSGQQFRRPKGQFKAPDAAVPEYGPCQRLDYELELGVFVGAGNALGEPMDMERAEADWFGLCLLNDWSARDVQAWEYQPLGPFLAKNFATTISPWIVTQEALAPFRVPFAHPADDPQPLPYLDSPANRRQGGVAVQLQVQIQTAQMRAAGQGFATLSSSDFRDAYWTVAQMLAHHSANGCNLQPGDLLGSGTQSGPQPEQGGSLLELSQGGKQPLTLPGGETRRFLQDGDAIALVGRCDAAGAVGIGFGPCVGTVLPAV
ncbi:fumarylacetoacetase [Ideonella alba]|uniref:fumarylacetoacetase n=1 Tax=Ideonella alba TaxID=2824118 RepID=A0A940YD66_9BURK|nr:fumarylacetoacetase [Ideonella alba]MBQ0933433.1 fumarylacetoacetase [Ideonella alba]